MSNSKIMTPERFQQMKEAFHKTVGEDSWENELLESHVELVAWRESAMKVLKELDVLQEMDPPVAPWGGSLIQGAAAAIKKLREMVAERERERDAWMETARRATNDIAYYQGLLDRCAPFLGEAVFIADDGGRTDSPLRAKVPELVEALAKEGTRLKSCVEDFLEMNPTLSDAAYQAEHGEPAVVRAVPRFLAIHACAKSASRGYAAGHANGRALTLDVLPFQAEACGKLALEEVEVRGFPQKPEVSDEQ